MGRVDDTHRDQVLMTIGAMPPTALDRVDLGELSIPQLRLLYASAYLRLQAHRAHGRQKLYSVIVARAVRMIEAELDRREEPRPDCLAIYHQVVGHRAAQGVS